jgi:ribonuclease-3
MSLAELERIIGYTFRDQNLLRLAMSHPSLRYDGNTGVEECNQRLEFLGDAVIQLVISNTLYQRMHKQDEGLLTKLRATLVSARALAKVAREINLGPFLLLARSELANGGRERESALADAMEAMFGALFLDGGLNAATLVAERLFSAMVLDQESLVFVDDGNPKGQLQEIIQTLSNILPTYDVMEEAGPDHNKRFHVVAAWNGHVLGEGQGSSKRVAQAEAARTAVQNPRLREIVTGTAKAN